MLDKFVFPETKLVQCHGRVGVTLASVKTRLCVNRQLKTGTFCWPDSQTWEC